MSTLGERITWREGQVLVFDVQCKVCRHWTKGKKCAAFPDGIPATIWINEHDHRTPYPGDNGIQFEPIEEGEAE